MIIQRPIVALILMLPLMLFAVGCEMQRPVETIRDRADFLYERERYAEAASEYAEIADRYPGDWRAQYRLGLTRMELNDLTAARRALELAHSLRPGDDDIAEALAEVMFRQDDEQHLYAFLRQRAESTQTVKDYRRLAHYALLMGDPDSARTAIRTAIRLDGGQTVEPYLDAANLAEHIGDIDEAVLRLRQALYINPRHELVNARLRDLGEIPGPTFALPPDGM
jgi:tetratricopeptide (TPR) repeat protein